MTLRIIVCLTLFLQSVNGMAADTKAAEHAPAHESADKTAADVPSGPSDHYVHHWVPFPPFKAISLEDEEAVSLSARPGRATVLVFLASWCVPCQQQIQDFKRIEEKFRGHYTDFYYIFAHDTERDAQGFRGVYKLGGNALLGSAPLLEAFHQPEIPAFYVADRYQWLILRRVNTGKKDLADLERFLSLHTAF